MSKDKTIYDTDQLTNEELMNIGLDPRTLEKHNRKARQRCTECNKSCNTPTTRYTIKGIDILKKDEAVCTRCLNKRISTYNTLIQMVENGKIKLQDL